MLARNVITDCMSGMILRSFATIEMKVALEKLKDLI